MNDPKGKREERIESERQRSNGSGSIGLDQDEQQMNGDYGMPETEFEDEQHKEEQ